MKEKEKEEKGMVYIPNHPAIQAAARGLAAAAKLEGENAHWYLPPKLAALLGAANIRPDEADEENDTPASDHLVADWPPHWFAGWQYRGGLVEDCHLPDDENFNQ